MNPESHPESPCIGVCEFDRGLGVCLGCLRTKEEISGWPSFNAIRKQEVLERLAAVKKRGRRGRS